MLQKLSIYILCSQTRQRNDEETEYYRNFLAEFWSSELSVLMVHCIVFKHDAD